MKKNVENKRKKVILICTAIIFAVIISIFALAVSLIDFHLELNEPNIKAEYAQSFKDPGASVFIGRKKMKKEVLGKGKVDIQNLGKYELKYEKRFLWRKANVQRTVVVEDSIPPKITLISSGKAIPFSQEYHEEGFSAWDNHDGDITSKVKREVVKDVVYYSVEDSSGNIAKEIRVINYYDDVAPKLHLNGSTKVEIGIGDSYIEPGFSANDNIDGDITSKVKIKGTVNTNIAGTYKITYSVEDSFKNKAQAERIIIVKPDMNFKKHNPNGKVIYLTFDDGPSVYTTRLLGILKKYNVKATFFVVGHGKTEYLDDIVRDGHAIGLHTMTHDYAKLYSDDESFMREIRTQRELVKRLTGVDTTLIRFPGGSSNTVSKRYNAGIMTRLTKRVEKEGYTYFDWNVSSGDAGATTSSSQVYLNVINGVQRFKVSIVLQHDSKSYSVDAAENIIRWGLSNGYTFKKLTANGPTVHHPVNN